MDKLYHRNYTTEEKKRRRKVEGRYLSKKFAGYGYAVMII